MPHQHLVVLSSAILSSSCQSPFSIMSQFKAASSSSKTPTETRLCLCGKLMTVKISRSESNPGRKYWKCPIHGVSIIILFKWYSHQLIFICILCFYFSKKEAAISGNGMIWQKFIQLAPGSLNPITKWPTLSTLKSFIKR